MSTAALPVRLKRIHWRAHHRGMRELDQLIGGFAEARLATMTPAEIDQFEALLEVSDPDMLAWLTGMASVPAEHDTPLFRALQSSQSQ